MRLFLAIDLPDDVKTELWYLAQRLEHQAQHARVVPLENYHLTLLFIGETALVTEAHEALHRVRLPDVPVDLTFDGIGSFKQQKDYTWWVGVKVTETLVTLARELTACYRAAGFVIETRSFKPHITLARKVTMKPAFGGEGKRLIELNAPTQVIRAERLSLMRSTNEGGHMVYTEMDSVGLSL